MAQVSVERMTTTPEIPALLTIPEVARLLRISVRQAYRLAELGEFPSVRVGQASVRVDADELAAYIERRRESSQEMREPGSFPGSMGSRDRRDEP